MPIDGLDVHEAGGAETITHRRRIDHREAVIVVFMAAVVIAVIVAIAVMTATAAELLVVGMLRITEDLVNQNHAAPRFQYTADLAERRRID